MSFRNGNAIRIGLPPRSCRLPTLYGLLADVRLTLRMDRRLMGPHLLCHLQGEVLAKSGWSEARGATIRNSSPEALMNREFLIRLE
jgi:hypothetical protein